jgi:hypothetical protein
LLFELVNEFWTRRCKVPFEKFEFGFVLEADVLEVADDIGWTGVDIVALLLAGGSRCCSAWSGSTGSNACTCKYEKIFFFTINNDQLKYQSSSEVNINCFCSYSIT